MTRSKLHFLARRYPIVPSMLTYSILYPTANGVQQVYFRETTRHSSIDWKEVSRFSIYGGLCHATLVYSWLKLVARLFPRDRFSHLSAKLLVDQVCFVPVALSSFYVGLSILEGKDKEGIYKEWRSKFPSTWAISFFVWPFLQTINFKVVPPQLQPIYVGVCSFFWTMGLAALKHNQDSPDFVDKFFRSFW